MIKQSIKEIFKLYLSVCTLFLLGFCAITFCVLYVENTNVCFISNNKTFTSVCLSVIITIFTVLAFVFQSLDNKFIFKLSILFLAVLLLVSVVLYLLNSLGVANKISSVKDLQEFIKGYNSYAVAVFIAIQFLQVIILPIPSIITVGAGTLIFGWFWCSVYSVIGIVSASITAFYIGRKLGYKAVSWLIGEENLLKGLNLIKGKDKIALTITFLLPFFPDDLLCFVSGLSSMTVKYFAVMIAITKTLGITFTTLSLSGKTVPLNTWWGILIWLIFFAITVIISMLFYKRLKISGLKYEKSNLTSNKLRFKWKNKNGKNDSSHRLK